MSILNDDKLLQASVIELHYTKIDGQSISQWLDRIGRYAKKAINDFPTLRLLFFWIHDKYVAHSDMDQYLSIIRNYLPNDWCLCHSLCRATHVGDHIDTCRYIISVSTSTHILEYVAHFLPAGYSSCLNVHTSKNPKLEIL